MRKILALMCLALLLVGCAQQNKEAEIINTVDGNLKTYYEMSDGTWQYDGKSYQHRLEISGKMSSAAPTATFVYLTNFESMTFRQAFSAAGFSSSLTDYFSPEDAVLVEWRTE